MTCYQVFILSKISQNLSAVLRAVKSSTLFFLFGLAPDLTTGSAVVKENLVAREEVLLLLCGEIWENVTGREWCFANKFIKMRSSQN